MVCNDTPSLSQLTLDHHFIGLALMTLCSLLGRKRRARAEEIAESTELLIDTAAANNPNKTMIKMLGAGLKQVTLILAEMLPEMVTITTQVVTAVEGTVGF